MNIMNTHSILSKYYFYTITVVAFWFVLLFFSEILSSHSWEWEGWLSSYERWLLLQKMQAQFPVSTYDPQLSVILFPGDPDLSSGLHRQQPFVWYYIHPYMENTHAGNYCRRNLKRNNRNNEFIKRSPELRQLGKIMKKMWNSM